MIKKYVQRSKALLFKLNLSPPVLTFVLLAAALFGGSLPVTAAQDPVALGVAGKFAVLAGSTVTSGGATAITGDLGVWPGTSVAGFPPGNVTGTMHVTDPTAQAAQGDLTTAFNDAEGRTLAPVSVAGNIGGRTLPAGLYKSTSALEISAGNLTLDGGGDPNAVFIFQIATTLITSSGRQVILTGGARAKNVFWQVGTSATIGSTSAMKGTILADQSISLGTGASLVGRALARIGGVSLLGNAIIRPAASENLFAPCAGPYHGLFYDTAAGVQRNSSGFVTLLLESDGSFNGNVIINCDSYQISGDFDDVSRTATVTLPNILNTTVSLALRCGADQITGTITRPNWQASLEADRKGFSLNNPVPQNMRGRYTLVIPADPASPNSPAGDGFGTLSLSSVGIVTFNGATADGNALNQMVPISAGGDWPLFECLYGGGGSLIGWMKFTAPRTLDNALTSWTKPVGGTRYPDGFANETSIHGSKYVQPAAGTRVLNFADGVLAFSGASVGGELLSLVRLTANNSIIDQSQNAVMMSINPNNGVFHGTFLEPGTAKMRAFHGVVLQSSNAGWGYFLGGNQSGHVYFGPR
jgi:hypothetical protein